MIHSRKFPISGIRALARARKRAPSVGAQAHLSPKRTDVRHVLCVALDHSVDDTQNMANVGAFRG